MSLINLIKDIDHRYVNSDSTDDNQLVINRGLTNDELQELELCLPCPIPDNVRELLLYTSGFENGPMDEGVGFANGPNFGLEEIFPSAVAIADTNSDCLIIDLLPCSKEYGPIFFACHDPPVIAYCYKNLEEFIKTYLFFLRQYGNTYELDRIHSDYAFQVCKKDPGAMPYSECICSEDETLKNFAQSLGESYTFIDLRNPKIGDGFSLEYDNLTRFGDERIFAYQVRIREKRSFWKNLFG